MTSMSDETPQPVSQAMDRDTAIGYVERTHGQLQMFLAGDGQWYLYDARNVIFPDSVPAYVPATV